jgi:surface antigen
MRRPAASGSYSRFMAPRLSAGLHLALALGVAALASGCAMSLPMSGGAEPVTTGSISGQRAQLRAEAPEGIRKSSFMPGDVALASAALSEAFGSGRSGTSVPWANPASGARGTVAPLGGETLTRGEACRAFLASRVTDSAETWMRGEACRNVHGAWDVKSLQPMGG